MKRAAAMMALVVVTAWAASVLLWVGWKSAPEAKAATLKSGYFSEQDLGVQELSPTLVAAQLTVPPGTRHIEFHVAEDGAAVRVRGAGIAPTATVGFPWPPGHMRKEANDPERLSGLRFICDGGDPCTLYVMYTGDRRIPVP